MVGQISFLLGLILIIVFVFIQTRPKKNQEVLIGASSEKSKQNFGAEGFGYYADPFYKPKKQKIKYFTQTKHNKHNGHQGRKG